jgi:AraC-like DNA-binding protein
MQIFREITPLKDKDVFVVLDNVNKGFNYPIHNHPEYELNLVMGISGSRIVGDITEPYIDQDLVLLGPYLHHKWDGDISVLPMGHQYRVITVQFGQDLFNSQLLQKERCYHIKQLLDQSTRGIKYGSLTIERAKDIMDRLTKAKGFDGVILFLSLLDLLAHAKDSAYLASAGFNPQTTPSQSRRIQVVYAYILKHFTKSDLQMGDVADVVNMSESAFSHFFKKYTNKSFTQFLIDVRIGYACKLLLDTSDSINQVSYGSGFNNLANFNRLFRKYRGCTPMQFRKQFQEESNFDWTDQLTPYQFMPDAKSLHPELRPESFATRLVHT